MLGIFNTIVPIGTIINGTEGTLAAISAGDYRAAGKTGIQTLLIAVATAVMLGEGATALAGGKGVGTAAIGNAENAALKNAAKEGAKLPRYDGLKPTYHVNEAHIPGRGMRASNPKTPLPPDAQEVFKTAVPNDPNCPTAWFGKNANGQIYRYSLGNNGTAHFSGIHGVGSGTRNLTPYAVQRLGSEAK